MKITFEKILAKEYDAKQTMLLYPIGNNRLIGFEYSAYLITKYFPFYNSYTISYKGYRCALTEVQFMGHIHSLLSDGNTVFIDTGLSIDNDLFMEWKNSLPKCTNDSLFSKMQKYITFD